MAVSAATPTTAAAWNAYYAGAEHPYCTAACGPLIAVAAAMPVGRAVDVGCGCGHHARALADLGWHVEAVDYSSAAIEIARAGGDTDLIDYHLADACWWHPRTPAHLVVIAYPTLAPNALNALIARAAGWTTPEGTLLYAGDIPTETTHAVLLTHFRVVDTTAPDPVRGAPTLVCVRPRRLAEETSPPRALCGSGSASTTRRTPATSTVGTNGSATVGVP